MIRLAVIAFMLGMGGIALAGARQRAVIIYEAPGCQPCRMAEAAAKRWPVSLYTTVDCPKWVQACPTFHWQDDSGQWRKHGPEDWTEGKWTAREAARVRGLILGE